MNPLRSVLYKIGLALAACALLISLYQGSGLIAQLWRAVRTSPTDAFRAALYNPRDAALRSLQAAAEPVDTFRRQPAERQILDVSGTWCISLLAEADRVTGKYTHSLLLWDGETGQSIKTLAGSAQREEYLIERAIFSPSAQYILAANKAGWLRLWDVRSGQEAAGWRGGTRPVRSLAWSPDGKVFAVGTAEDVPARPCVIRLYDAATREKIATLPGHEDDVTHLTFSDDSRRLFSASLDESIRAWDVASGRQLARFDGHTAAITGLVASRDGKLLVSASRDNCICLWDLEQNTLRRRFAGNEGGFGRRGVGSIALTRDGSRLISCGEDGQVRVWDPATAQRITTLNRTARAVWLLSDDRHLLGEDTALVQYWQLPPTVPAPWPPAPQQDIVAESKSFGPLGGTINLMTVLPDGARIMAASGDGSRCTCICWDIDSGWEVTRLTIPRRALALSPDGRWLAAAGSGAELSVLDSMSGQEVCKLSGHLRPAQRAVFAAGGKYLITSEVAADESAPRTTLYVWRLPDGALVRKLEVASPVVTALAATADPRRILVAGAGWDAKNRTPSAVSVDVQMWDVEVGRAERRLTVPMPAAPVTSLTVSADGKRAISGMGDGAFVLWNLQTGSYPRRTADAHTNRGGGPAVTAVAFSPDTRFCATGGADSDVHAYTISYGTSTADTGIPNEQSRFERTRRAITSLVVLPDGRVLSGSNDGLIRVWAPPAPATAPSPAR